MIFNWVIMISFLNLLQRVLINYFDSECSAVSSTFDFFYFFFWEPKNTSSSSYYGFSSLNYAISSCFLTFCSIWVNSLSFLSSKTIMFLNPAYRNWSIIPTTFSGELHLTSSWNIFFYLNSDWIKMIIN